jgi:hypothetical protein
MGRKREMERKGDGEGSVATRGHLASLVVMPRVNLIVILLTYHVVFILSIAQL